MTGPQAQHRLRAGHAAQSRPPGAALSAQVGVAVAEAREELARTDTKAGTLLTLATGALAGLLTFAHAGHVPVPAAVALWLATSLTVAALGLLLAVVRPRLGPWCRSGMLPDHQQLLSGGNPAGLHEWQASRLRALSALAVAKHRRVRHAVDLLLAALAVLAVAALLTAGGA
jgi:hypothetical protein